MRKLLVPKDRCFEIGLIMLLLYGYFYGLRYQILHNSAVIIGYLLCSVIFICFGFSKNKIDNSPMTKVCILCVLIIACNRNARFDNHTYIFDLGIIIMFSAYLLLNNNNNWFELIVKLMPIFALFYGLSTVILFLYPNIYINTVAPLFGGENMTNMIRKANQGLAIGFSNHYSTTAIYLATSIGIPISVFINRDFVIDKKKRIYWFLSILCLFAVLLTGKRAHSIFIVLSALVAYFYLHAGNKLNRLFKIISAVIVTVAIFYIASELYMPLQNIIIRFKSTIEGGDVTLGRAEMWETCVNMFKSNPLFGCGWGAFTYTTENGLVSAHNVYVQILAENGIVLSSPFILFIFGNFYRTIKAAITIVKEKKTNDKDQMICSSYSLYIQAFFILYCFTGNPMYDFQFLCPYIFACAMGEFLYKEYCCNTD